MATVNNVSQPPLGAPITDSNGLLNRAWSNWFRDIYKRIGYKGGNSIDDNKEETDQEIVDINASLTETIEAVNVNIENIETNKQSTITNADNLTLHEELETAHGSNGVIVGFDDLADEAIVGLVKRMDLLADAISSTVNIVTPDIATAPATYNQAYTQTVADLINENKASINILATDLNNSISVLNALIANSKTSGQMTT